MEQTAAADRVDTPINRTLEEVEKRKSEYRNSKQMFFGRAYRRTLTIQEQDMMCIHLQNTLDQIEWLLDVCTDMMSEDDKKKVKGLMVFFIKYDYTPNNADEFRGKLGEAEELLLPHIGGLQHQKVDTLLDAGNWILEKNKKE